MNKLTWAVLNTSRNNSDDTVWSFSSNRFQSKLTTVAAQRSPAFKFLADTNRQATKSRHVDFAS
jgi:hypothetical protein